MFNAFEKSTGYNAAGNWRAGFSSPLQNGEPALGLQETDKIVFARWAHKRPATPQELEYVAAGGFPTLALHPVHGSAANLYGIAPLTQEGFYCVRDIATLPQAEQDSLLQAAAAKALDIQKAVEGK